MKRKRKIRHIICRDGICPKCGKNWEGLIGSCVCGYCGPLKPDE